MDDRVEGRDAAPRCVAHIQGQHCSLPECDAGGQLLRQRNHLRREVDAQHLRAALVQIAGDMPWPAAHIADRPARLRIGGEPVEQLAVERLMLQLVEDPRDILLGNEVVALFVAFRCP